MNNLSKNGATLLEVGEDGAAQRVDNFLIRHLKGVPKSHVYRVLRSGEVRVNSARVRPGHRLQLGDRVRVPPVRLGTSQEGRPATRPARLPVLPVLHEDAALLVIDKPAGVAVHGGSGVSAGVIEALRAARPDVRFLELAHRLDRDTSGLLVLAKKRSTLVELHRMLREGEIEKDYTALVKGRWHGGRREIRAALRKTTSASGERRVRVDTDGKAAVTRVAPLATDDLASLLAVRLLTGRTHQIRVHLAHVGHPVVGDDKYGDFEFNRQMAKAGLRRLCLHAGRLVFRHPVTGDVLALAAPLPEVLQDWCTQAYGATHG